MPVSQVAEAVRNTRPAFMNGMLPPLLVGATLVTCLTSFLGTWQLQWGVGPQATWVIVAAALCGLLVGAWTRLHSLLPVRLWVTLCCAILAFVTPMIGLNASLIGLTAAASPIDSPFMACAFAVMAGLLASGVFTVVSATAASLLPCDRNVRGWLISGGLCVLLALSCGLFSCPDWNVTIVLSVVTMMAVWLLPAVVFMPAEKAISGPESCSAEFSNGWAVSIATGMATGLSMAALIALLQFLIPATTHFVWSLLLGPAAGWALAARWPGLSRTQSGLHATLVAMGVLVLIFPVLIVSNLHWNSGTLSESAVLILRALMTCLIAAPCGWTLGALTVGTDSERWFRGHWPVILCFALFGTVAGWQLYANTSHWSLVALCACCCSLGSIVLRWRRADPSRVAGAAGSSRWIHAVHAAVPVACGLLVCACSIARPGSTEMRLFSTEAFLGHRSHWDGKLLGSLGTSRLLRTVSGWGGPITVRQLQGGLTQIRQNGIPRAVWSHQVGVVPNPSAEIVQSLLPLILSPNPDRVLVVGLGSGTIARAVSSFAVRTVDVVEPDRAWIALVNNLAADQLTRPWMTDDRFHLRHCSLELAALSREHYDVILLPSCNSYLAGGQTLCTRSMLTRYASQLSEQGMLAMRLECGDWGAEAVAGVCAAFREALPQCVLLETGTGEMLLIGSRDAQLFACNNLATRLEAHHVSQLLATAGWDWSMVINLPAYDTNALQEFIADCHTAPASIGSGRLASRAHRDLVRWGPKQQELAVKLSAPRSSAPVYLAATGPGVTLSRKSRMLEWMGPDQSPADLLRRLSELAAQQRLISDYPETYQWEYRKVLRKELQDRPRTAVTKVAALVDDETDWHPEDRRRKSYFALLGNAARSSPLTMTELEPLLPFLNECDPLLTLFAHHELADLTHRAVDHNPADEARMRLYGIFFAPTQDTGVRRLIAVINLLVEEPAAVASAGNRYDYLNCLVPEVRQRWERKGPNPSKSTLATLQDLDSCIVAIEQALPEMEQLAKQASIPDEEWQLRKESLERLTLRPLRSYRALLQENSRLSVAKTRMLLDKATNLQAEAEPNGSRHVRQTGHEEAANAVPIVRAVATAPEATNRTANSAAPHALPPDKLRETSLAPGDSN